MIETVNGVTIYDGPSAIDGADIIGVVTFASRNEKNGNMPQLWILRKDQKPSAALRSGADASVCGSCPLRMLTANGERQPRRCYVNLMGPEGIWIRFTEGAYPFADVNDPAFAARLTGRAIRLGAYGDPAALPFELVERLVSFAGGWTGYTHQWQTADPRFATLLMASADTTELRDVANARGYRTFRIRPIDAPILSGEITCPASIEAGKRTTCNQCGLCNGKTGTTDRRKDIVIQAHGTAARRF